MQLKSLNDETLLSQTDRLVREERELLTAILHHLREIERRRLFSGFSSLFAYAAGRLGYSEDQAYRRITAMRLLNELPEIENELAAGTITLTHISVAQSLFKKEKKRGHAFSTETKREVFETMRGLSTREAQKVAGSFSCEPLTTKLVNVPLSEEKLAKLEKLKGWLAHKAPDLTHDELIGRLCDLALEQWDPARPSQHPAKPSRAETRRQVWRRDGGACTKCGSHYAVEEDHIVPASQGGEYSYENIRLLCRSCNQRAAIEKLGHEVMDPYISLAAPRVNQRPELAAPRVNQRPELAAPRVNHRPELAAPRVAPQKPAPRVI